MWVMRSNVCIECALGVVPADFDGLILSISRAPIGDLIPRKGVMGFGGSVSYVEKGKPVTVQVVEIDPRVRLGDRVWVNKVGDGVDQSLEVYEQ